MENIEKSEGDVWNSFVGVMGLYRLGEEIMQKYLQWGVTPWLTARANGAAWRWKCMQLGMLFLNVMNYNEFSLLFTYFSSFQINLKGQTFSLSLFTFSFLLWNYKEFSIHYEEGLCRNRNNKHTCFLTHKLTHTHTLHREL